MESGMIQDVIISIMYQNEMMRFKMVWYVDFYEAYFYFLWYDLI